MSGGKPDYALIYITCPDAVTALELGEILVVEGLAACANVIDGLRSVYYWQGELQRDDETLLLVKSAGGALERLITRAVELHPYDTPCVVALPIVAGNPAFLDWINEQISPDGGERAVGKDE